MGKEGRVGDQRLSLSLSRKSSFSSVRAFVRQKTSVAANGVATAAAAVALDDDDDDDAKAAAR